VARDRKRAKQRQQRRAQRPGAAPGNPNQAPEPHDHLSGEVDEFEAAVVRGASEADEEAVDPIDAEPGDPDAGADTALEGPEDVTDELGQGAGPVATPRAAGAAGETEPRPREGNRVTGFLRASWAELRRVQWPDRRQTGQGTAVTLGFVVIAGAYLGLLDALFSRLINLII
jgi:preprotein translocase SecE subunit